ncbi:YcbJ family phosphotransferase [Apirhabdus apintestini]|uniref:YcbJ family phosphotransferase n=1 Tax=Erwinia sp. HR93 TaxID=3094840 RepID=UPI002ADEE3A5|nr:YcbJ family phosphotransferase [Erwinia sp. HR93]MEA1064661.1 YcbJ family phosphotransferase [Erwinia sp. HR93]WPM85920.1 YcbJ family phosphotransferase [Enterobacteriaceae bacterium CA-0114]
MERLRKELSHLLGENLSRLECVNAHPETALWSLYDKSGLALPLLAKTFTAPGVAARIAWKIALLARYSTVRMPNVYGVITHEDKDGGDVLLLERLRGVSTEAPARTPERWAALNDQIVEALLTWHQVGSDGCVGDVDSTQENSWPHWYQQRVEVIWSTISRLKNSEMNMERRRVLFRSRDRLHALFRGFSNDCVLVHGNITLRNMLKDTRTDKLTAILNPGVMLWAPREYELFQLWEAGAPASLLSAYLKRAPVDDAFVARRWLYLLWHEARRLVMTGAINAPAFDAAARELLPWLV